MAQRTEVVLVDDVDGSPADETVLFELDGARYEIDLTAENADELRRAMQRWIVAGRRTGGRRRRTRGRPR